MTDPTGFSWLSKAFNKVGNWLKQNWRTIIVVVVNVVVSYFFGPVIGNAVAGALSSALNGGSISDIARAAVIGGVTGGVNAYSSQFGPMVQTLSTATVTGLSNEAMGGKFQDGFINSLKMQAVLGTVKLAGQMLISKFTKQYMNGSRNISIEEDELLSQAGYNLHRQMDAGSINSAGLNLPKGCSFKNYEESNLDYAVFENQVKGITLMNMVGTQTNGDWIDNFMQGVGFKSPQYTAALKYASEERSIALAKGYTSTLNGHSLSGGLASAAVAATGSTAAIFNAAGLHPNTLRFAGYSGAISRMGQGGMALF